MHLPLVLSPHVSGESASSGVWYHGVIGSGIWLHLGRVLDLSCLHSPPRPHYERPHHVTVASEVEPCAAPAGGAYAEASVAAMHAGREHDSSRRYSDSSSGSAPHQAMPRWLQWVVRDMPEDLEVGRWLVAKGYDTMIRRYHLDTAPPPLLGQNMQHARLEVVDVRGLPSPSEACPGTFRPCASNLTAFNRSREAAAGNAHAPTHAASPTRHRAASPATTREACGSASSRAVLRTGRWPPERPCGCVQDEEVLNCGEEDHPLVWRLLHDERASSLAVGAMNQCNARGHTTPSGFNASVGDASGDVASSSNTGAGTGPGKLGRHEMKQQPAMPLLPLRQCNPRNRSFSLLCATWTPPSELMRASTVR